MRLRVRVIACVPVLALVMMACGSPVTDAGSGNTSAAQPASSAKPTPEPEPIKATVRVSDAGPQCAAPVKCWLPTQFKPEIYEGTSVSLEERLPDNPEGPQQGWPLEGDLVDVLCVTTGEEHQDKDGQPLFGWYRIRVPEDKAEPKFAGRAEKASDGEGYRAYVAEMWLVLPGGVTAARC